jgi:hypothetical protein
VGPIPGIAYLKIKTDRAKVQLDELNRQIAHFIESDPYSIAGKDDIENSIHIVRLDPRDFPEIIGLLAGEFAYSLRSGLDQLAWQLALLNVARPNTHTSFPIRSSPPDLKKGFGDATKHILPAAVSVIQDLQPYQRGTAFKDHPLWILNELCVTDKHMIMPVNSIDMEFHISGVSEWKWRDFDYSREIAIPLSEKNNLKFHPTKREIVFGEPILNSRSGFEVRLQALDTIHNFIRDEVIPRFAGFFK